MENDDVKMDSDSEGSSSDDENAALEERARHLEETVSNSKYQYDAHVELVGLYKQLADLTSMRMAYRRFHETYPLTETLWMNWITDEMGLANTDAEKKEVLHLFEKATEDYLSVKIWLQYVQYSLGCCEIEETKSILEKGLNVAGLHVEHGCLLWDTLRELELFNLPEPASPDYEAILQRVSDAFKRQLSVPLLHMERTYQEWQDFAKQHNTESAAVEWGYKQAVKALRDYKPFEDRLLASSSDEEAWTVFKEYIAHVKDPSQILCLYERAIERLCLVPDVWSEFCSYAFKLGEVALKISERAVRNVTWAEEIWVLRLRILEKYETDDKNTILRCFENGISMVSGGLDLWLAYLDFNKRHDPEKLPKLFEQAEQQLAESSDPTYKIMRFHARTAAESKDMATARSLWSKIMHNPQIKTYAHYWIEYLNLERQYGTAQQARTTFIRSLTCCKDWPQSLGEEWLAFERIEGSVDDIFKCTERIRKLAPISQLPVQDYKNGTGNNTRSKKEFASVPVTTVKKRRLSNEEEAGGKKFKNETLRRNQGVPVDMDPLKSVFVSNLSPIITEKHLSEFFPKGKVTLATNSQGLTRCFGYVQFKTEEESAAALARDREPLKDRPVFISKCKTDKTERQATFKFSTNTENNKLFVRGLPLKYTKEDVEAMYKPYNYADVRLVLHKSGQSKGLAYVDFKNEDDAENALKATNGITLDNFVISVAISAPPEKQPGKKKEVTRNSKSRLQIPLVPRSVQVKAEPEKKVEAANKVEPKSNSDFRKLLLKQ